LTVAEAVAEWLDEKGIRHAFGIIGAGNLALWEAIYRKGKTRLVSVHHEQAAAMAASFYQRTTGRIEVCLVTTGAGSTNAITGVMAAWMDSTPLIVISGNEPSIYKRDGPRVRGVQGYATDEVAAHFTKYAIDDACYSSRNLEYAYQLSMSGRPGPVWIDIARNIQTVEAH